MNHSRTEARLNNLTVPRTARYATLGPVDGAVDQVWFVFHGYGQLAHDFLAPFRVLDDGSRLIVAPEGLSRFYVENPNGGPQHQPVGASWMTREGRTSEIDDYVRYLDLLYQDVCTRLDGEPTSVHLLGFSQGAATASRWAVYGTGRVDRLILWAGLIPPDLDAARARSRLGGVPFVVVAGNSDPYITREAWAEHAASCERLGLEPELIGFDGAHRLSKTVLSDLAGAGAA